MFPEKNKTKTNKKKNSNKKITASLLSQWLQFSLTTVISVLACLSRNRSVFCQVQKVMSQVLSLSLCFFNKAG